MERRRQFHQESFIETGWREKPENGKEPGERLEQLARVSLRSSWSGRFWIGQGIQTHMVSCLSKTLHESASAKYHMSLYHMAQPETPTSMNCSIRTEPLLLSSLESVSFNEIQFPYWSNILAVLSVLVLLCRHHHPLVLGHLIIF